MPDPNRAFPPASTPMASTGLYEDYVSTPAPSASGPKSPHARSRSTATASSSVSGEVRTGGTQSLSAEGGAVDETAGL
jgi:hypothetical protein